MSNRGFLNTVMDRPVDRHPQDFYPTPSRGMLALMDVERFSGWIWEPACGDGRMSEVLITRYRVMSSDLYDRGYGETGIDFLRCRRRAPNVVTNPPFTQGEAFVRHALTLARYKVVILMRVSWLEGQRRKALFTTTPLARVWIFSKRLGIPKGDGPSFNTEGGDGIVAFAWYVWEHGHVGPPTLGWLE